MQIHNPKEFNLKLRKMLCLGNITYFISAIGVYFALGREPAIIKTFIVCGLMNCVIIYLIGSPLNFKPDRGVSWLITFAQSQIITSVALACHFSSWPKGSFIIILMVCLASLEVQFIINPIASLTQYLFTTILGTLVFSLAPYSTDYRSTYIICFLMLTIWKFMNHFYFGEFIKNSNEQIKVNTYKKLMANMRHELNNTSTIILGFSRIIKKKPEQAINKIDKLDNSIKRMVGQINSFDNYEKFNQLNKKNQVELRL